MSYTYKELFKKIINYKHFPLITLIIISLSINIFYFNTNKAIWWDEASYLNFVNFFVKGIIPHNESVRGVIFPVILSLFGFINNNEFFLRIGLITINLLTIFGIYVLLKQISDRKKAFIGTLLFQTNFTFMFYQLRFLTEIPSTMLLIFSTYFFLKKGLKNRIFAGTLMGFAIGTRFTSLIIIPSFILYDLISKKKIKYYIWIPLLIIGLIPNLLIDVLVWEKYPFFSMINFFKMAKNLKLDYSWDYYIKLAYHSITFSIPFFLIGFFNNFKKKIKKKNILIILFFLSFLFAHSFLSNHKENRFIIPILPIYFFFVSSGIFLFINLIKKYTKNNYLNYLIISLICFIIINQSINIANSSILSKSNSYIQIKEATIFLQNYLKKDEIILGNTPQIGYYSQREIQGLPPNSSTLYKLLKNNDKINTIVLSMYEGIPDYIKIFNSNNFTIINEGLSQDTPVVYVIKYNR